MYVLKIIDSTSLISLKEMTLELSVLIIQVPKTIHRYSHIDRNLKPDVKNKHSHSSKQY